MTSRGTGDGAIQVACALAESFFSQRAGGGVAVPLDAAHLLASGRLDLWNGWARLPAATKQLVGRLLRVRRNELASRQRFLEEARRLFGEEGEDACYRIGGDTLARDVAMVYPCHGQDPLVLAERLLVEIEAQHARRRAPLPVAASGTWAFGRRRETRIELPDGLDATGEEALRIVTAPEMDRISVSFAELSEIAAELDGPGKESPWRLQTLTRLFQGLRDCKDLPVSELDMQTGGLGVLNAPTGVGKSLLTRMAAIALARRGVRVVIVVRLVSEVLSVARDINKDLAVLGQPGSCVPLVAARRLHEKALSAAEANRWEDVGSPGIRVRPGRSRCGRARSATGRGTLRQPLPGPPGRCR